MSRESPAYRLTLRPPAAIAAALLCLLLAGCGSD
jgi:hypothetical protein